MPALLILPVVGIYDFSVILLHLAFSQLSEAQRRGGFYRHLSLRSYILYLHVWLLKNNNFQTYLLVKLIVQEVSSIYVEACYILLWTPIVSKERKHGSIWQNLQPPHFQGPSPLFYFRPPTLRATPSSYLGWLCSTHDISDGRVSLLSRSSLSSFQSFHHAGCLTSSWLPGSGHNLPSLSAFQTFVDSHYCHASSATLMDGQMARARNKLLCL